MIYSMDMSGVRTFSKRHHNYMCTGGIISYIIVTGILEQGNSRVDARLIWRVCQHLSSFLWIDGKS